MGSGDIDDIQPDNPFRGFVYGIGISIVIASGALSIAYLCWG